MHNRIRILWSVLVLAAAACTGSLNAADPQTAPASTKEPPAATSPASNQKKIDVNKATVEELETLPGVGAATANAIVNGRPYHSVNELTNVAGISSAKLGKIKPLVTVSHTSTRKPATATTAEPPTPAKTPTATHTAPVSQSQNPTATTSAQSGSKPAKSPAVVGAKVNLNTATKEELDALPGIGPTKAQAIIDARPFKNIEDVQRVKGIKEGVFSKIKDQITVD